MLNHKGIVRKNIVFFVCPNDEKVMKKIMYFAAALLMFAGCRSSQEARENAPAEVGTITGTIKLPQGPNKIVAPAGWEDATAAFTMKWETGDEIYIKNEFGECKKLTLKSIDEATSKATFEGELLSNMESYSVAYGYDLNSTEKTFAVPYVEGNYRPFADGTGTNYNFTVNQFGPVLGLKLKGTDALSKIVVVLSDNANTLATYTMTLNALQLDATDATNVYFPIKSKEGATKMSISFYKTENETDVLIMTKTTTNITQVAAGKVTTFAELTVPDPYNGHAYVDLGLSVKWATCNVGATNPEDYGDYFAWGETEPYYSSLSPLTWKTDKSGGYAWRSYKYMQSGESSYKYITKYTIADNQKSGIWYKDDNFIGDNKTVLESIDDAASANWGDAWRMPTKEKFDELLNEDNCTRVWCDGVDVKYNDTNVTGWLFTSKKEGYTDKSIFLPAAGYFRNAWHYNDGSQGDYWSASLDANASLDAIGSDYGYGIYFTSDRGDWTKSSRCHGWSVRAVCN